MFDTMVFTKALGALCGALLILLLGKWVADSLYVPGSSALQPAFVVDTGVDEAEEGPVELSFAEAFRTADADAGARVWSQCRACHVADEERNGVGPYLYNVVGREVGAVEGFSYSGALPDGEIWTPEMIYAFVENPRAWAPGTSMSYAGLRSQQDRVNVIAFLIENSPDYDPSAMPSAEEPVEEAAVEEDAPADEAVAEDATEEEAPAEETVAEDVVEEEAPAEEAVAEETATEEAPAEEAVAEDAVEEEAPAEEAVAEEAATEEAPAEEAVAEDAVEEEAPAEEAVAEDAVEEEAPAEEAVAEETATEEAPAEEMSAFAQMVAEGDVSAGARVWNQCRACHIADAPTNRVGPHLVDIVGRESNSIDGFRYSGRLPDVTWTLDELDAYLENPRGYAPGTSMAFNGLRNQQDRANVLAYIQSLN